MSAVGDLYMGRRESRAAERATSQQMAYMQQALDYLKEREAIPQELREGALKELGALFGLGGEGQGIDLEQLQQSPVYQAITSGRGAGEEAILRQSGATGGLRSGNAQDALARYSGELENKALLGAYQDRLSGLQGLAGLQSNALNIAQLTSGLGQVQGAGTIAQERAWRDAYIRGQATEQQNFENFMDVFGGIMGGGGMSDERLKKDIVKTGETNGIPTFRWSWNDTAKSIFGLVGKGYGTIAQRIKDSHPEAVGKINGYYFVHYNQLGVPHG